MVVPLQNSLLDGFTIRDGNASENFGDGIVEEGEAYTS